MTPSVLIGTKGSLDNTNLKLPSTIVTDEDTSLCYIQRFGSRRVIIMRVVVAIRIYDKQSVWILLLFHLLLVILGIECSSTLS